MVHGWMIIDKPEGMSSAHVVAILRRLFKQKKIGHGGTLDPLASGALPIALGEATKALSYILESKKSYQFKVKWGESRSTDDQEGEILNTSPFRPSAKAIEDILPLFVGDIDQVPPPYSALKINGQRAYNLARAGKKVDLPPRRVSIESLCLIETSPDSALFEVTCSKGTYVRSLARDLALHLGTYGHVISLRRLQAGPFHVKNAILLDSLLKMRHNTELIGSVLPLQDALVDILALEVADKEAHKLRQGQFTLIPEPGEDVVLVMCKGIPQALAKREGNTLKPLRVFNIKEVSERS